MIKVHHLNNSRSQRVLWLLEELTLPYEVVRYQRDPQTMLAPRSLRDIHPLGKAPIIEDGSLRMAETGAIFDYLVGRYGHHLAPPPDTEAYWRYRYWLHYAEGSAMPPLLCKLILNRLGALGWPARRFVDGQIALHLDYLELQLASGPWFVADAFSAADIMMSFPLEVASVRAGLNANRCRTSGTFSRAFTRGLLIRGL